MERLSVSRDRCGTEKKETNPWFVARPTLLSSTAQDVFLIERYRKNAEVRHICGLERPQKEVSEWTEIRIHPPEFQECAKANTELATDHRDAGNELNSVARRASKGATRSSKRSTCCIVQAVKSRLRR